MPSEPLEPAERPEPAESREPRAAEACTSEFEEITYPTLCEPFTATGEAFSVPLSALVPDHPTLQETTTVTGSEHTTGRGARERSGFATRRTADPVSIGAGLVFFLLGGAYLLASGGHLAVNAGWTLSFLLLGLGLSGVVGSFLRARLDNRNQAASRPDEW